MPKTFDQTYAESGRQSELDQLRASGQYESAKAAFESSQGLNTTPSNNFSTASMVGKNSTPTSSTTGFTPTKTFDQFLAESGRQSELDRIRSIPGQYEIEKAKYESGGYQTGAGSATGVGLSTLEAQPTIDLQETYKGLYQSSGIESLETEYSDKEKRYIEAKASINDNPFLSEAERVGRIAKIDKLFQERTANLQRDIATKKADVETQLNLQLKQLDINSQATQQAWDRFNSLLNIGALDNVSGETIANLTRQTGISSDMIQSAISSRSKQDAQTQVIKSENDAGEVTVSVINTQTGEVISQKSLGAVGTKTKSSGGASGSATNVKQQFINDAETIQGVSTDAGWVGIFPQLVAKYAPTMSLQDIYKNYLGSSVGQQYGTPGESADEIKEIYDAYRGS